MNDPTPARVKFSGGQYMGSRDEWGFYTNDLPDGFLLAPDLVGKTVNIGTKDGDVYDTTTVTAFDGRLGVLTLTGGQAGASYRDGPPRTVAAERVQIHDIARGYVHDQPDTDLLGVLAASVAKLNTARTIEDVIKTGAVGIEECDPNIGYAEDDEDDDDDDPNPNDPPSPAADLLDALIGDAPSRYPGMLLSDIADTCPGGIGEAALVARDHSGSRFLLVALPLDSVLGRQAVTRAEVRRLLAEREPDLAAVIAATERKLERELLDNPVTGVPMVCTACRKPARLAAGQHAATVWVHKAAGGRHACPAPFDAPVMVMVAAGNENVPLAQA